MRRPARPHPLEPRGRREPSLDPRAAAREQPAVDGHLRVDVEERQLGQVDAVRPEPEELAVAAAEQVHRAVRDDRALGDAGRARREVDGRRVGGPPGMRRPRVGGEELRERDDPHADESAHVADDDHRLERGQPRQGRLDRVEQVGLDDDHAGARGRREVLEEHAAVVDVDRHLGCAEGRRPEPAEDELDPVAQHQEDAVAGRDAEAGEAAGDAGRRVRGLRERDVAVVEREREVRAVAEALGRAREQRAQDGVVAVRADAHASRSSIPARSRWQRFVAGASTPSRAASRTRNPWIASTSVRRPSLDALQHRDADLGHPGRLQRPAALADERDRLVVRRGGDLPQRVADRAVVDLDPLGRGDRDPLADERHVERRQRLGGQAARGGGDGPARAPPWSARRGRASPTRPRARRR